jgi:hypothetical protein
MRDEAMAQKFDEVLQAQEMSSQSRSPHVAQTHR